MRRFEKQADACPAWLIGQRPIIFLSNGYDHWIWNDTRDPPRPIQGFLKRDELQLAMARRTSRKPLSPENIDAGIVERFYQHRAIRRVAEAFEKDGQRKALVVMATGAGKTRTVIALCDLPMRANRVKRVLFLADRTALVRQAANAFRAHLPDAATVNLLENRSGEGRVFVSTHPTMMRLIDEAGAEERRFGVGHFDLVVIDEAHRSVYRKYRAIFDDFEALLAGLTATPIDEVARDLSAVRPANRRADRRLWPRRGGQGRFSGCGRHLVLVRDREQGAQAECRRPGLYQPSK